MSRTAPPTRPSTATSANGMRNQIGSKVVSAPMGSVATASLSSGIEPAKPEAGQHKHEPTDYLRYRTGWQCGEGVEVDVGGHQDHIDHGKYGSDHGDPHLQLQDELKTEHSADHDQGGHQDERDDLVEETALPSQAGEHSCRGQHRKRRKHG